MKKQLSQHGMAAQYGQDPEFALRCRMVVALAFVPIADVSEAHAALHLAHPELWPLLDWLEDHYIGRPRGNGHRRQVNFFKITGKLKESVI